MTQIPKPDLCAGPEGAVYANGVWHFSKLMALSAIAAAWPPDLDQSYANGLLASAQDHLQSLKVKIM